MSYPLRDWDRYLNSLIDEELYGSAKFTKKGTQLALELWKLLLTATGLSFARPPAIVGSTRKQTHLGPGKYDFDTILPINVPKALKTMHGKVEKIPNKELEKVIKEAMDVIADFFETRAKTDPNLKYEGKWPVNVSVTYKGIKFDLVPAINFQDGNKEPKNTQWVSVLGRYAEVGTNVFGPSMFQKVLEYLLGRENITPEENNFCLRVIVLAKMWKKNMRIILETVKNGLKKVEKMCAESTIIELLAMKAAQEEWKKGKSITLALEAFLNIMATPMEKVKVIPDTSGVAFPCELKKQLDINEKKVGGIVSDPVDPYLNYLDPKRYNVVDGWAELQWAAKKSLAILNDGCSCGCGKKTLRYTLGIFDDGEGFPGYD